MTNVRNDLAVRGEALPSIEKARAMLAACITHGEVKRIRAIAQAVASLEKGRLLAVEAGKILVECDAKRAELEREEKAGRPKHTGKVGNGDVTQSKLPKKQLVAESRRAPLLDLSEADKSTYFAACERTLEMPSPATAATLAKMPAPERKEVFAKLGEAGSVKKAIAAVRLASKPDEDEPFVSPPVIFKASQPFEIDSALSFLTRMFSELLRRVPTRDMDRVLRELRSGTDLLKNRKREVE